MAVLTNKQFYILGGVAALAGLFLYSQRNKINPFSDENLVYQGANSLLSSPDSSVGSDIYDTWNPDWTGDGVPDAGPADVALGMLESVALWFVQPIDREGNNG